ncbi:hypothetical protein E2562_011919 [Oryza meyeriana var. granulata]|uniref:DUF834 domain-containing protein n=1 Tax=Oryza meyeriana var. granulata TaxID=110450 RepID=A0A6G1CFB9_9ORYZ|nr:hypothetical protein E2562_011919 [Oryza meyeriana var. granulata]
MAAVGQIGEAALAGEGGGAMSLSWPDPASRAPWSGRVGVCGSGSSGAPSAARDRRPPNPSWTLSERSGGGRRSGGKRTPPVGV